MIPRFLRRIYNLGQTQATWYSLAINPGQKGQDLERSWPCVGISLQLFTFMPTVRALVSPSLYKEPGGPPSPSRDRLKLDNYGVCDDKTRCFCTRQLLHQLVGVLPHPTGVLIPVEDPCFGWLPFAAGRNSGSS